MNRNLSTVLSSIEQRIMEGVRLLENDEFLNAQQVIRQAKSNLNRIRQSIAAYSFDAIDNSIKQLEQICEQSLRQNNPGLENYAAPRVRTGGKGRPKVLITKEQIELFVRHNFTAKEMAKQLGCSTKLIYLRCYSWGIKLRDKYFNGNDALLYQEIERLHSEFPNSGSQMMTAYLKVNGLNIQRKKVRQILAEIDPIGTASRWSTAIRRRTYKVPTPNALWHIDAHLKLVRWKFAIHGCIDGYSRMIIYLKCTTSMCASSVVPLFAEAVTDFGLPSRVRSDFGYENLFVAVIMNALRGTGRGSHITGRSVHNQRVERLWVDVVKEIVSYFQREFYTLEDEGMLDVNNDNHMFALQKVYLEVINNKLLVFQEAWNCHKIRTEKNKSPSQLWLSGMLEHANSTHTATNEIFGEPRDLYTHLMESLELDNVPILTEGSNHVSSLTININLGEVQLNEIENILGNNSMNSRSKYIQIRSYLDGNH